MQNNIKEEIFFEKEPATMDNKKLMQILLKDITDLEILVGEMKASGNCEPLEMELLYTKISGVRYLLEVMEKTTRPAEVIESPSVKAMPPVKEEFHVPAKEEPVQKEMADSVEPVQEEILPQPIPEPVKVDDKPVREAVENNVQPEVKNLAEEEVESPPLQDQRGEDVELEDEPVAEKQTLGERFVQGRSVNDLLLEHGKPDSKFSNMPVVSLQSAIGINDRFLFTRELFEGNTKAFNEVISRLDSMASIHDAALFLRENYKWRKNETSLKFINLVKRRFL